ncbi:glycosyltransferase family 39 protein [Sinirhodobacter sp. WL0062]|uniref:Glycosyltransferase family 39 protein n=1 Tax=Rhodobacter flavimaris TaxID=2907145 RepID=A0ABS8Z004_9RHOB|nr:glycosyltransferase family 39 protein [Sinirhodobacter sp. WL0062]MCE5973265.1 glycosyltransferase family 39 protein [Sinirhodobacter sp. WL0062]
MAVTEKGLSTRQLGLAMIAGFAAVAVLGVLLRPLIPIDETRYIDVAWEMRQRGSWFLPLKNFQLYTDKPPMLFWLMNLAWTVTGGVSEFAARLVGPIFAVLTLMGTWALGRRLWDDASGALAAVVLAGMSVFALYGGATMFDTMLSTATLAGLWAMLSALAAPGLNRRAWAGLGLALGFGILAKGPVILFHLGPALAAYALWSDPAQRPAGRDIAKGAGLAFGVALALVGLWVVPAAITGGAEYRHMILWEQTAGRTVQSFAHARPWYWLLATLPLVLFPWVWTPALWSGLRSLRPSDRALRLCLVQAGAGFVLFSLISGKQVHYLLPEMPAVALIFGRGLVVSGKSAVRGLWGALPAAVLAVLLGGGALGVSLGLWGDAKLSALLHPVAPVVGFALVCALLAVAALRQPRAAGMATLGLGLILAAVGLIATTGLHRAYDAGVIGRQLALHQADGVAVVTDRYNDEFDFEGRLFNAIDLPKAEEAAEWLAAHPSGMLAGICKKVPLDPTKAEHVYFYGADWCLWEGKAG